MPAKRSQRSRLIDSGYSEFFYNGQSVFTEPEAHAWVERLRKRGFLARVLRIRDYNIPATWFIVMYKHDKSNLCAKCKSDGSCDRQDYSRSEREPVLYCNKMKQRG